MRKLAISKLKIIFIPSKDNNFRPKFLESKVLIWIVVFLFLLKLITIPFLICFPKISFFSEISKTILLELINKDRKALGLAPLKESDILNKAANLKAQDMLLNDYFSHQNPQGLTPWYWLKAVGYNYQLAGENLAIGFLDSEEVYQAWLNSPSHKANILNPHYQEIGIAVVQGDFKNNKTTLVVQYFGAPQPVSQKLKVETKEIKKEISAKNDTFSIEEKKASSSQTTSLPIEIASLEKENKQNNQKAEFNFLYFFSFKYYKILQIIIYGVLILMILALMVNIFVRFDIQHRDLILKALILIFILGTFILLDKETTIKLIPHNFDINQFDIN